MLFYIELHTIENEQPKFVCEWLSDTVNSVCEENNSGSGNARLKGVRVTL